MMNSLVAAALALASLQDGTLAPDRGTYNQLVRCAGVHRASVEVLRTDTAAVAGEADAAGAVATGFQRLAWLLSGSLGVETSRTDAEIAEATIEVARPYRIARTSEGLRLAREGLETERAICAAVLQRISGTS